MADEQEVHQSKNLVDYDSDPEMELELEKKLLEEPDLVLDPETVERKQNTYNIYSIYKRN